MAKNSNTTLKTGLGLAAAAAAAAGLYYFYGSDKGKQHRRNLKSWTVKARGEVMEKMEKMKDISQASYKTAVKDVLGKYKRLKNINGKELAALGAELYGHWNGIAKEISRLGTTKKRTTKKK